MSSEMGVAAVQALQEAPKDVTASFNQAAAVANQAMMAQRFEIELTRSSELSSASFQAAEESRRKANIAQREDVRTSDIPEVQAPPVQSSSGVEQGFVNYIEGFRARGDGFTEEINSQIQKVDEKSEFNKVDPTIREATEQEKSLNPGDSLRLMVHAFQFGIEAQLISSASSLSTRVFNDLMKGQ